MHNRSLRKYGNIPRSSSNPNARCFVIVAIGFDHDYLGLARFSSRVESMEEMWMGTAILCFALLFDVTCAYRIT